MNLALVNSFTIGHGVKPVSPHDKGIFQACRFCVIYYTGTGWRDAFLSSESAPSEASPVAVCGLNLGISL